jgi:hypothetical protein
VRFLPVISVPVLPVSNLWYGHARRSHARPIPLPPGHSQRSGPRRPAPPGRQGGGSLHGVGRHLGGDPPRYRGGRREDRRRVIPRRSYQRQARRRATAIIATRARSTTSIASTKKGSAHHLHRHKRPSGRDTLEPATTRAKDSLPHTPAPWASHRSDQKFRVEYGIAAKAGG